jgi:hypoxanthine-DNA glycosylase
MATYFGFELSLPYEERLTCLSQQGIALWDVLQQCEREGSLDSAIQKNTIQLNPILEFVQALGSVKLVLLNGGKAATEFNKHFQKQIETEEGIRAMVMPSTSPAYAAMPIEEKQLKWHQALDSVFKT